MSDDARIPFHITLMNAQRRHILCMKWGNRYGPEYVNRLYGMVRRQLLSGFRFTCLTDDPRDIRSEVECLPIPELGLPSDPPGCGWVQLAALSADLYGRRGTAIFLDLDVVIVGALDPFFDYPGQFLMIRDERRRRRGMGNPSVCRFEIGANADVLEHLREHLAEVSSSGIDAQAFLSNFLQRQGRLAYWPATWCQNFTHRSIPVWPTNYLRAPFIPPEARVVVFNRECNPQDAMAGQRKRPVGFVRSATWVAKHWRE